MFAQNRSFRPSSVPPATFIILVATAVTFLTLWLSSYSFASLLALNTGKLNPWTLLTYPIAEMSPIGLLFGGLWAYFMGTKIEKDFGTRNYLLAYFGFALAVGLLVLLGTTAAKSSVFLAGMSAPLACITAIWAGRYPRDQICLYGIVRIASGWIALVSGALLMFGVGMGAPVIGMLAICPVILAYLYGGNRLPLAYPSGSHPRKSRKERKKEEQEFTEYVDNYRQREQERKEKDELRKLFERSLIDDPDDHKKQS